MAKYGMTFGVQAQTFAACALTVLAFLLQLVGFSTPEWLVGPGGERSPFLSIGWHQACFEDCQLPYCPAGDIYVVYDGCYKWTFNVYIWDDDRMKELRVWLLPEWFDLNRILVIVGLPVGVLCVALMVLSVCFTMGDRYTTESSKSKDILIQVLLYVTSFLIISTAILCIVGICMFYVNSTRLDWLPMPEKNSFGYSYWLVVAAAILYMLAFLCTLSAAVFKTLRTGMQKDPRYSEEMMLGK